MASWSDRTELTLERASGVPPSWTVTAYDGADDDGGTLYVLSDLDGRIVSSSAWPTPLERIAALEGYPVVRAVYDTTRGDCEVPRDRFTFLPTEEV